MKTSKVIQAAHQLSKPYRITNGKKFRLKDVDPADTGDLKSADKPRAKEALQNGVEALAELQDVLYAQDRWSLLLIFQAMDAAGKDGTIKHVMSGVNPQGCQVSSFKGPTSEDLDHDYLWRCVKQLPERGRIGIFNRSYYEETLVVRVHPEFLAGQKLPKECVTKDIWKERFQDIRAFERYLHRNGTAVVKFFLHVSKEEQQKRFLERLDDPDKNWKFSAERRRERGFWDDYMERLRANHSRDRLGKFAVVCGAGGQQMVYPCHCRGGGHRCVGCDEVAVSESQRGQAPGISGDEEGIAREEMSDCRSHGRSIQTAGYARA